MAASAGRLLLIPNTLGGPVSTLATADILHRIHHVRHFLVEEIRSARRLLKGLGFETPFEEVSFELLNEHTKEQGDLHFLLPAIKGSDIALISEAGCPCIADPGSLIIRTAHRSGIRVVPMGVPSSILLTLMGSGLNGQSFAFSGYLPRERQDRIRKLRQLDQLVQATNQTQLFMDAPYRNNQVLEDVLLHCRPSLSLCIGAELTMDKEFVSTKEIHEWKVKAPDLHKRPVIFALGQ